MNSQACVPIHTCTVHAGGGILPTLSAAGLEVWLPTGLLIVQQ